MRRFTFQKHALLVVGTLLLPGAATADIDDPGYFAQRVYPILKKHCSECHGGRQAKGGLSINTRESYLESGHAVAGQADESYFLDLVESDDPEVQMPPKGKPRVAAVDRAILRDWVNAGMPWDAGSTFAEYSYNQPLKLRRPTLPPAVNGRTNPVDRLIDQYLVENGTAPLVDISDAMFLRRAYSDLVGLLPTPDQLAHFQADPSPQKRTRLVRELLADDQLYAEHWLSFWNDLLRNDYDGAGFITDGRQQITVWLYDALLTNLPFNQFAQELIAPSMDSSRGFIDGIRWRGSVSAAQSIEVQFAQNVSQAFLGINLKCASCHDSFIDDWKLDDAYGLAAVYAESPLEIHRCDKPIGRLANATWMFPELGNIDRQASQPERLRQLGLLITHRDNGRFHRTVVNRLWHRLMGRGIVHPIDAMQTAPWNAELLDYLAIFLQDHDYDLKSVLELIATSKAYQTKADLVTEAAKDQPYVFRGPRSKRMTAEQFVDAIWQISDTAPEIYDAAVVRGRPLSRAAGQLQLVGKWIWGPPLEDALRPGGETVTFHHSFSLRNVPTSMFAVITCDNEYVLYVNGQQVASDVIWQTLESLDVAAQLREGENHLTVVARNSVGDPNPAGLYFESRLHFADGTEQIVATDGTWRCTSPSNEGEMSNGDFGTKSDGQMADAIIVEPQSEWTNRLNDKARQLLIEPQGEEISMVRASLLKSDAIMRRLGRPSRDQIVAARPAEFSTLEAIELCNNESLATSLVAAGRNIAGRKWNTSEDLVRYLFRATLTRDPTEQEVAAFRLVLDRNKSQSETGDIPPEVVEDLLWAICMTPDFLIVR